MIKRKVILISGILVVLVILCTGLLISRPIDVVEEEPGWHDDGSSDVYYILEDGSEATGYQMIEGKPYFFDEDGTLAEAGWQKQKNEQGDIERFYCTGKGELATGWKYLDGKVAYFYQSEDAGKGRPVGAQAKNYTTSGGLLLPFTGFIDGDEGMALAYGIDVLNRYGWDLESAYRYASSLRFIAGSDEHYGLTIHSCALQGFEHGEGNCLVWAGTFCAMAKLLGYDCRLIWGTLEWKGTRPHAWTEIWEEDGPHVYDPRKHDGVDMAGFDVHYGDKGSYRYNEDSKQYLDW